MRALAALLTLLAALDAAAQPFPPPTAARRRRQPPPEAAPEAPPAPRQPPLPAPAPGHVSLRGSEIPLGLVLNQIARAVGLTVVAEKEVDLSKTVNNLSFENIPAADALAAVLEPLGLNSIVRDGQLQVFQFETRTFIIRAPSVAQSWNSSISNEGGQSGNTMVPSAAPMGGGGMMMPGQGAQSFQTTGTSGSFGARTQVISHSDDSGVWTDIESTLKAMVTTKNAWYSSNRSTGVVVVRDAPRIIQQVASYVDLMNAELSRQVEIEIKVVEVTLTDSRSYGLDWNLIFQNLNRSGVSIGTINPIGSTSIGDRAVSFSLTERYGPIMVRAMEDQGKVNIVSQPRMVVGNNVPVVIQVGQVRAYVSSISAIATVAGTTSAVSTSSLSDGLIVSLLPRVMADGTVNLWASTILQDTTELRNFSYGGGSIELPTLNRRSYAGQVKTQRGQTLIIAGLITDRKDKFNRGVPFISRVPIIGFFFGSHERSDKRQEMVIMITTRPAGGG